MTAPRATGRLCRTIGSAAELGLPDADDLVAAGEPMDRAGPAHTVRPAGHLRHRRPDAGHAAGPGAVRSGRAEPGCRIRPTGRVRVGGVRCAREPARSSTPAGSTFASDSLTVMVVVNPQRDGSVRLDGWAAPGGRLHAELRVGSRR